MNYSYKLKIRQQATGREDPSVRRIRTDHIDTIKKLTKQPLADNKKIVNNNQSGSSAKPGKKVTVIKSVLGKSTTNYSRLTTEPAERPQYLQHHRTTTATDKLSSSNQPKKPTNSTIGNSFKKK